MARLDLTAHRLREVLNYDAETGAFTWAIKPCKNKPAGMSAGCVGKQGYRFITIAGFRHSEHRLVWLHVNGSWPEYQIDHINGNRADNRLCNLRDVKQSLNAQNQKHAQRDNKSTGMLGVSFYDKRVGFKKFHSRLSISGKCIELGWFKTAEEASFAYLHAKRELHLGFIE